MKTKQGFSLIEVLVAMALLAIVLLILFRGFTGVTAAVSAGHRASQVQRSLENARRILEEDLSMMVLHPRWQMFVTLEGDIDSGAEELPVLAFLRYRPGMVGNTETEWVQYWREPRPDTAETGVTRWVRYAGPANDRQEVDGDEWWLTKRPKHDDKSGEDEMSGEDDMSGEIVLDALLTAQFVVRLESGEIMKAGVTEERPATLDVLLAASIDPLPQKLAPTDKWLQQVRKTSGGWIRFRVRPLLDLGPVEVQ